MQLLNGSGPSLFDLESEVNVQVKSSLRSFSFYEVTFIWILLSAADHSLQ